MTTTITTPTDDDAYPSETTFDHADSDRAQLMFSPTCTATAGQFDTEADQQR